MTETLIKKDPNQIETHNGPDFQEVFESMLHEFNIGDGKTKVVRSGEIIHLDNGIDIQQELFVEPKSSSEMPYIGARITFNEGKMEYRASFYEGSLPNYGKVWVGNIQMEARNSTKGISIPTGLAGWKGQELSEMYDTAIIQAAANTYKRRILQSVEVDYRYSERRAKLIEQGYSERRGYTQILDKFYNPQTL